MHCSFPTVLCLSAALLCTAALPASAADRDDDGRTAALARAARAADAGRWPVAQREFATALRDDLMDPRLQFLNGLAYEHLGRTQGSGYAELARIGYENAAGIGSGHFWAELRLGALALDRGAFDAAQQHFAKAVRSRPDRWEALYGLGAASYYRGDLLVATLAAERARVLAPREAEVLRLAAFVAAASGDESAARSALESLPLRGTEARFVTRRVAELLQDARLAPANSSADAPAAPPGEPVDPLQITVDVTIILSSLLKTENRGVNLFDGLTLQYGYSNAYAASRPSGGEWSSTRSLTQTISVPVLNYNLDLFNDAGQNYQVLARPTLTAYLGRESEFFAGRTVNVRVSGVNLGTLQPIDVGVGLKVTPEKIEDGKVTFRVSASRSFLSREEIGSFDESLTTFKQLVSATAEIELGQTLLLSALSENVQDDNISGVPGLGAVPGVGLLFKRSSKVNRKESLLILLTPSAPQRFDTAPSAAAARGQLDSLLELWTQIVDPSSNVGAISQRLGRSRFLRRGAAGDVRWRSVRTRPLLDEALAENLALAAR